MGKIFESLFFIAQGTLTFCVENCFSSQVAFLSYFMDFSTHQISLKGEGNLFKGKKGQNHLIHKFLLLFLSLQEISEVKIDKLNFKEWREFHLMAKLIYRIKVWRFLWKYFLS